MWSVFRMWLVVLQVCLLVVKFSWWLVFMVLKFFFCRWQVCSLFGKLILCFFWCRQIRILVLVWLMVFMVVWSWGLQLYCREFKMLLVKYLEWIWINGVVVVGFFLIRVRLLLLKWCRVKLLYVLGRWIGRIGWLIIECWYFCSFLMVRIGNCSFLVIFFKIGCWVMWLLVLRILQMQLVLGLLVNLVRLMVVLVWLLWVKMLFFLVISGKMWLGQ